MESMIEASETREAKDTEIPRLISKAREESQQLMEASEKLAHSLQPVRDMRDKPAAVLEGEDDSPATELGAGLTELIESMRMTRRQLGLCLSELEL